MKFSEYYIREDMMGKTVPNDENAHDDEAVETLFIELGKDGMIKPYMQDELRHRVEAGDVEDFLQGLFRTAIYNQDYETIERFVDDYQAEIGDFEMEAAVDADNQVVDFLEELLDKQETK